MPEHTSSLKTSLNVFTEVSKVSLLQGRLKHRGKLMSCVFVVSIAFTGYKYVAS